MNLAFDLSVGVVALKRQKKHLIVGKGLVMKNL
jgi:hypothetical protein